MFRKLLALALMMVVVIAACKKEESGTSNNNNGSTSTCSGGPSTVTDVDGNVYNVVTIGNQCWMKENLKTSKYRNGDAIPTGLNNTQWQTTTQGAWAYYNDSSQYNTIYGKLYNWYAVADARGVCPTGWHVPTVSEWNVLVKQLDPQADTTKLSGPISPIAGGFMKSVGDLQSGTGLWQSPNTGASDSSGFSGQPGGARDDSGVYSNSFGYNGIWWSSSVPDFNFAGAWGLTTFGSYVNRGSSSHEAGFSVRCLRD